MHRRSFLSLSALSAVPVVARAAEDAPEPDWYETITSDVMKIRCSDTEDCVVFEVELFQPAKSDIKEVKDAKGEHLHYLYKDKPQPYGFHPGVNLIRRFDLTWEGKAMKIPERFWNDLFLFPINNRQSSIINLLPLRRGRHRAHRMGTPRGMRLPLHHPLDRQQIRRRPQTQTLPAA